MHVIAHTGVYVHRNRESAPKVDLGRKIPRRTGKSNLRQQRAVPTLYQLSYIPNPVPFLSIMFEVPRSSLGVPLEDAQVKVFHQSILDQGGYGPICNVPVLSQCRYATCFVCHKRDLAVTPILTLPLCVKSSLL